MSILEKKKGLKSVPTISHLKKTGRGEQMNTKLRLEIKKG